MDKVELYCKRCRNLEFIEHPDNELQCAKCGEYVPKEIAAEYRFAAEHSVEKQEKELKRIVKSQNARLIATILSVKFNCSSNKEFKTAMLSGFISPFRRRNVEELDKAIYWSWQNEDEKKQYLASHTHARANQYLIDWVDIYLTGDGTPIVAYYLYYNEVNMKGYILLIGEKLPIIASGKTHSYSTPVYKPDQIVYTGATVGGITTGGFHTQSGGIDHYETHSFSDPQKWFFDVGRYYDGSTIILEAEPIFLLVYEYQNLPSRLRNKAEALSPYVLSFLPDNLLERLGKNMQAAIVVQRKYGGALPLDDKQFKEMVMGTSETDADVYSKACKLMEKGTRESLLEAGGYFNELGEYEDSVLKKETCYHKASSAPSEKKGGCYVATAVYGSYDCPQVWTLRRYRDSVLVTTWYGRAFVRSYYAISPTLVKWFGGTEWFKNMWKPKLDKMVKYLNMNGVADTPYFDRKIKRE